MTLSTYKSYAERADRESKPYVPNSSIWENFGAGVSETVDEFSSYSSLLHKTKEDERDKHVKSLIDEGKIPEDVANSYSRFGRGGRKYNYNGITEWANKNLDLDELIPTMKELEKERNEEMALMRRARERTAEHSTGLGTAARFAGGFVAGSLDPPALIAGVVAAPVFGSVAASRAIYTAAMARRAFVGGAAAQAVIEPFIWSWQTETEGEYGIMDSVVNIAASGMFDATLTGTAAFFGHGNALKKQTIKEEQIFDSLTRTKEMALDAFLNRSESTMNTNLLAIEVDFGRKVSALNEPDVDGRLLSQEEYDVKYEALVKERDAFTLANMKDHAAIRLWSRKHKDSIDVLEQFEGELDILKLTDYGDGTVSIRDKVRKLEEVVDRAVQGHAFSGETPPPARLQEPFKIGGKNKITEKEPLSNKPLGEKEKAPPPVTVTREVSPDEVNRMKNLDKIEGMLDELDSYSGELGELSNYQGRKPLRIREQMKVAKTNKANTQIQIDKIKALLDGEGEAMLELNMRTRYRTKELKANIEKADLHTTQETSFENTPEMKNLRKDQRVVMKPLLDRHHELEGTEQKIKDWNDNLDKLTPEQRKKAGNYKGLSIKEISEIADELDQLDLEIKALKEVHAGSRKKLRDKKKSTPQTFHNAELYEARKAAQAELKQIEEGEWRPDDWDTTLGKLKEYQAKAARNARIKVLKAKANVLAERINQELYDPKLRREFFKELREERAKGPLNKEETLLLEERALKIEEANRSKDKKELLAIRQELSNLNEGRITQGFDPDDASGRRKAALTVSEAQNELELKRALLAELVNDAEGERIRINMGKKLDAIDRSLKRANRARQHIADKNKYWKRRSSQEFKKEFPDEWVETPPEYILFEGKRYAMNEGELVSYIGRLKAEKQEILDGGYFSKPGDITLKDKADYKAKVQALIDEIDELRAAIETDGTNPEFDQIDEELMYVDEFGNTHRVIDMEDRFEIESGILDDALNCIGKHT